MKRIKDMNFEERKAFVADLNVIDDSLFHKIIEDKDVAEEILRVLMNDSSLQILDSYPQDSIKNIIGKSVILDALIKDSNGTVYNVEVQKNDDDDHIKRARYNQSCIDTRFSEKGIKYYDLPDVFEIFILRFDIFKGKKSVYNIKRIVDETGEVSDNGVHEMYINATADDGTVVSELMKFFNNSNGWNSRFPLLSERVDYFKNQEEGVNEMCEWSDRILQEGRKEGRIEGLELAKRIFKAHARGVSAKEIANIEHISEAEVLNILEA